MGNGSILQFESLQTEDGSWGKFLTEWREDCASLGQDFDDYGTATLGELGRLAEAGHKRAEVFALKLNGKYSAVCQGNCTPLPSYDGPVLRIRFMTFSPEYDFGDKPMTEYASLLGSMLAATINLSENAKMKANHIKFHLRSPADIPFFTVLGTHLGASKLFRTVQTRGAWLYITKV